MAVTTKTRQKASQEVSEASPPTNSLGLTHLPPMSIPNGHKRLSEEERQSIPGLYVATGSKTRVAELLGCNVDTVDRWVKNLQGEEWERIQDLQRQELLRRSVEILYQVFGLLPDKVADANLRDLLGAVKIIRESAAAWGGMGAAKMGAAGTADELEQLLAGAELKRRQAAIEEALKTGSLEGLKAFAAKSPEPVVA